METRGDVMIRLLWDRQINAIIDIKLGNADADSYIFDPIVALLDWWEKIEKDKHSKHLHNQQKQFSPFFLSVDGILGSKSLVVLENLSQLIAAKMD